MTLAITNIITDIKYERNTMNSLLGTAKVQVQFKISWKNDDMKNQIG